MELADSHCHLDDAQFASDREAVIERAFASGLKYMLSIGTGEGPPDLGVALRVAERYPNIYATAGVHPNDALKVNEHTFTDLSALLRHPKIRAVGEIGLDSHWGVPIEAQVPILIHQLEMAAEAQLPIVIHMRDAWTETVSILRAHWAGNGLPCVMHCFTGNPEQARECLDLGFYLAYGGVATFPKAAAIREAAKITPGDRILLETDAPYLAPAPHRGKRNEPAFIAHTARIIAEARGISPEQLAAETSQNFERVFRIRSLH